MANDPSDWDVVSPEMIEQYKAEWKKNGFPDLDFAKDSRVSHGNDINDVGYQPLPEQWLWVGVLIEAIGDFKSTSGYYDQPCLECHDNQPCGHIVDGKKRRKGRYWNGSDWAGCPYNHTYHQCAVDWLKGDGCKEVCDMLNIDVDYFRHQIGL